jgi:thiol-disulfide isomerase/thioredoxin
VVGGLIVLVVALAVAAAVGFALRYRQGRFQQHRSKSVGGGTGSADPHTRSAAVTPLTAEDLGAPLGERATLVQFSTEFCTYCPPTRALLTEVAAGASGVTFVEIDAAHRLDLARRLRVFSTPTVLVLAADGTISQRAAGKPRKSDLLAAVRGVLGEAATS